ncbi:kynurenine 3-monooxygenase [Rhodotorula paludigena]|uniref:kynurenine 3-monooxygenase n=1 Tax=Rhodotorula paludigena TaxID=86838 RepID=UPI00316B85EE
MTASEDRTALVAGAGLVGTLCAAMLASRGWTVTLIEGRTDPRTGTEAERARSINLALSPRGIEALRSVSDELVERVLQEGIEMRGRMLHKKTKTRKGKGPEVEKEGQDYGRYEEEGECIRSISRTALGIHLLDHVDGLPKSGRGSVTTLFETRLVEMDLRKGHGVDVVLRTKGEDAETRHFDFVVGGDGAYSKVRQQMMRGSRLRFDYRQFYAPHSYLELSIPAGSGGTYLLEPNYLHIWPRGEFMLIALANQDKSFTLTLFAHHSTFSTFDLQLKSATADAPNPVVELFRQEFPDALEHMGEEALLQSWRENPKDGLVMVECSPYHYEDKVLLIGDAAHAMVPFYGQGMNCGFEDVRVLSSILDHFGASPSPLVPSPLPYSSVSPGLPVPPTTPPTNPVVSSASRNTPLAQALTAYTALRAPSLSAIQTLAHRNYTEMASAVLSPLYLLRLSLDSLLSRICSLPLFAVPRDDNPTLDRGGRWESLYRMTTFRPGLAYEEVIRRREWQGRVLDLAAKVVGGFVAAGVAVAVGLRLSSRYEIVRR